MHFLKITPSLKRRHSDGGETMRGWREGGTEGVEGKGNTPQNIYSGKKIIAFERNDDSRDAKLQYFCFT